MPRSGIMLCYPFEESRLLRWGTTSYVYQDKLDGDRGRIILDPKNIQLLSSEEHLRNFALPHLVKQFSAIATTLNAHGIYELDGEFYRHRVSHEDIHSIVSRTTNRHDNYSIIQFHIFDHIVDNVSQFSRIAELYNQRPLFSTQPDIQLVKTSILHSLQDILLAFDDSISRGYEGMIVRNVNADYVRRRSTNIMKFKPKQSDTYTIIGWKEEIAIDGTPKGRLGALVCSSDDGTEFSVSAGLNDKLRRDYWEIRDELIGKAVLVHYQAKTKYGTPKFTTKLEII